MEIIVTPNFEDFFPSEIRKLPIDYFKSFPRNYLLIIIGLLNVNNPEFDQICSFPESKAFLRRHLDIYCRKNRDITHITLFSPYSILRFSEIILTHINELSDDVIVDADSEINLLKGLFALNSEYKEKKFEFNADAGIEKIVDLLLINEFQTSEIGNGNNKKLDLMKLAFATIFKVEKLLEFLSAQDLEILKRDFIESFNTRDVSVFKEEMKLLIANIFNAFVKGSFIFQLDDYKNYNMLSTLIAKDITGDSDFSSLKKTPIVKINSQQFTIVNYFFAIDLFYRGAKFKLKDLYIKRGINKGDFLSFFTTNFSEKFLMNNLLNEIFECKYYNKKIEWPNNKDYEPDYYVNYRNNIIYFENKDLLIPQDVKSSKDINVINKYFEERLCVNKKGIGQIIQGISSIYDRSFKFDNSINYGKRIEIFPILILHDRIFQTVGVNYKLNECFKKELLKNGIIENHKFKVHSLIIIDIDTLIWWKSDLKNNFKKLSVFLKRYSKILNENPSNSYSDMVKFNKYIKRVIEPISNKKFEMKHHKNEFVKMFSDIATI